MIIEGSGSGSIPLTSGSGSGRQKTRGSGTLAITQFISAQQEVIKFAAETKEGLNFHKQMTEAMVYPGQSKKEWGFQTVGGIAFFGGFSGEQVSLSGQLLIFFTTEHAVLSMNQASELIEESFFWGGGGVGTP
jgi:hypothetical protein